MSTTGHDQETPRHHFDPVTLVLTSTTTLPDGREFTATVAWSDAEVADASREAAQAAAEASARRFAEGGKLHTGRARRIRTPGATSPSAP